MSKSLKERRNSCALKSFNPIFEKQRKNLKNKFTNMTPLQFSQLWSAILFQVAVVVVIYFKASEV